MNLNNTCPPGKICINNFNLLTIIVLVLFGLYIFNKENNKKFFDKLQDIEEENRRIREETRNSRNSDHNKEREDIYVNRDRVALRDPLYPPMKRNYNIDSPMQRLRDLDGSGRHMMPRDADAHISEKPNVLANGVPINVETRGPSGDFQQIGMLSKKAVTDSSGTNTPGNNSETVILPLFGKPTYRGSNNWLYYAASDKFNQVKIPINKNSKDCTDDQGCQEINDGETINIPSYNGDFDVKIYKFDKPRYIPYVN
jgi:hypothetical protein